MGRGVLQGIVERDTHHTHSASVGEPQSRAEKVPLAPSALGEHSVASMVHSPCGPRVRNMSGRPASPSAAYDASPLSTGGFVSLAVCAGGRLVGGERACCRSCCTSRRRRTRRRGLAPGRSAAQGRGASAAWMRRRARGGVFAALSVIGAAGGASTEAEASMSGRSRRPGRLDRCSVPIRRGMARGRTRNASSRQSGSLPCRGGKGTRSGLRVE